MQKKNDHLSFECHHRTISEGPWKFPASSLGRGQIPNLHHLHCSSAWGGPKGENGSSKWTSHSSISVRDNHLCTSDMMLKFQTPWPNELISPWLVIFEEIDLRHHVASNHKFWKSRDLYAWRFHDQDLFFYIYSKSWSKSHPFFFHRDGLNHRDGATNYVVVEIQPNVSSWWMALFPLQPRCQSREGEVSNQIALILYGHPFHYGLHGI